MAITLLFTFNPKSCLRSKELQDRSIEMLKKGFQSNDATVSVITISNYKGALIQKKKSSIG